MDVGHWQLSRSDEAAPILRLRIAYAQQSLAWFVATRSANQRGITFSEGTRSLMQRQKGEIIVWHREAQYGFATTPEGKNYFVHESAFRDHRQVAGVCYGTLIEFDPPVAQTAEQAFLDKLNDGKFRDDPTVARNHRNPRRVVVSGKKPRAANVRVIGSQHPAVEPR